MTHDKLLDHLRNTAHWCGLREDHEALEAVAALIAENRKLRGRSDYRYVGKDGKPILARDLEDDRDRWRELAATEYERGLRDAADICLIGITQLSKVKNMFAQGMCRASILDAEAIVAAADKHAKENAK